MYLLKNFLGILFILVGLVAVASDGHGEKKVSEKSSGHGSAHWAYSGSGGPEHWGDLDSSFSTCKTGHQQSPIDLKWKKNEENRSISFHYTKSPLKIIDNGHTIQVNFQEGSTATIDGETFNLLQVHFHSSSEHTLSGKSYPLEAHFVHKDSHGKLGVVGVFFVEGKENEWLKKVWSNVPSEKGKEFLVKNETIDPAQLLPSRKTHYHYMGSLTTPPCSENVNWNVMNTPVEASVGQLSQFRKLYSGNNRPVQNINNRKIANH